MSSCSNVNSVDPDFLQQDPRICEGISKFPGECDDLKTFERLKEKAVNYLRDTYLSLFEHSGLYIYQEDDRVPEQSLDKAEDSDDDESIDGADAGDCTCTQVENCGHLGVNWGILEERRQHMSDLQDFDFIMTVTQHSINEHLKALYDQAVKKIEQQKDQRTDDSVLKGIHLAQYKLFDKEGSQELFSVTFAAPQVQLLCVEDRRKAIFRLNLRNGFLKTLGPSKSYKPE